MEPKNHPGNRLCYLPEYCTPNPSSPLWGKTVLFLGSSVTYGTGANGISFADYLVKTDGIKAIKEAVPGTTLADIKKDSYVSRLLALSGDIKPQLFVCQLSTNDAAQALPLGVVTSVGTDVFDTKTILGAMERIVTHVKNTYPCPIVFYTGSAFESALYRDMIKGLMQIKEKYGIFVIDLYHHPEMNAVSKEDYDLYMLDPIHPTMAGYRDWWLPELRSGLTDAILTWRNYHE